MLESKALRIWFGAALLMASVSCALLNAQEIKQPPAPADYRIHDGDVLQISVYQHPELSGRVVVRGDGNYPLTPDGVKIAGLSAADKLLSDLKTVDLSALEVAVEVRDKLKSVIRKPQVTVAVVQRIIAPGPSSTQSPPHPEDTPSPELLQKCCVA
jgi:protein involved in polysaccharide export with SLBB domain